MKSKVSKASSDRRQKRQFWLLASGFWLLASGFSTPVRNQPSTAGLALNPQPTKSSNCPKDIETLTNKLLLDLPSYANRVSQSARRLSRPVDVYGYVLIAGRPEFAPLTLGPGVYKPANSTDPQQPQQVFLTTLERQYIARKAVELQEYHWIFLTQTSSGWRLAIMFSRIGTYPNKQPPTPPRDSSDGVIAQAIRTWLRDCRDGAIKF